MVNLNLKRMAEGEDILLLVVILPKVQEYRHMHLMFKYWILSDGLITSRRTAKHIKTAGPARAQVIEETIDIDDKGDFVQRVIAQPNRARQSIFSRNSEPEHVNNEYDQDIGRIESQ